MTHHQWSIIHDALYNTGRIIHYPGPTIYWPLSTFYYQRSFIQCPLFHCTLYIVLYALSYYPRLTFDYQISPDHYTLSTGHDLSSVIHWTNSVLPKQPPAKSNQNIHQTRLTNIRAHTHQRTHTPSCARMDIRVEVSSATRCIEPAHTRHCKGGASHRRVRASIFSVCALLIENFGNIVSVRDELSEYFILKKCIELISTFEMLGFVRVSSHNDDPMRHWPYECSPIWDQK